MASPISLQDILDRMNDHVSNYTTGAIDIGNRTRAANAALEYLKRRMTLPSDEVIQRFYYNDDTLFFNLNPDFNEGLAVLYDNPALNLPRRRWRYAPYQDLMAMAGRQGALGSNYFSWTPINGMWQLYMLGSNLYDGSTLSTFDSLSGYTGSNDAENLAIDTNIYEEGSGSLSFDINPALSGSTMASITFAANLDLFDILNNSGSLKLYVYLPTGNLTEFTINLFTDAGDYYSISATTYDDGTAFSTALNQWKRVEFKFPNKIVIGSPDISNITSVRIDVVENASFGSVAVDGFRIDKLYSTVPDYMDLIYLSSYKGTDKTGLTQKIFLDSVDDIPAFGLFSSDILEAVALRGAANLVPQLLSNADFKKMLQTDSEDVMNVYGKSWPRKRILNYGKLILSRPRTDIN